MNILEQEDIIKGMPDASLQQEMSAPSGQVPQFLVLSEIQRRTDMRDRFEASEPQPTTTVRDQIMAEGLGASVPEFNNTAGMLPPNMGGMLSNSPVPARPNSSSPSLPVGDAPQGLAGMGVQYASTGGVVRMQQAGQVPGSSLGQAYADRMLGRGFYEGATQDTSNHMRGKAILEEKGLDWREYTDAYVNAVGARGGTAGIFPPRFMSSRDDEEYQRMFPVAPVPETAPLDYLDVLEGQSLSPEIEYEQRTGRDIDAPSVWDDAASRMDDDVTEENYPFAFMSAEDRARMPFGDRFVGDLREGGERAFEYAQNYLPAAGRRVIDMTTVGLSGDPRSPELVREEAGQDIGSAYDRFVREPAARLSQPIQEWAQDFDMVESGTDAYNAAKNYLGDDLGLREWAQNFDMVDAAKELGGSIKDGLGEYMPDLYAPHPDMMEKITSFFDGDGEIKETSEGAIATDSARAITQTAGGDPVLASLLSQQDDGPMININPRLLDPTSSNFIQTGAGGNNYPITEDLMDQRDALKGAQEDVAANLQELITQTRQDAKQQAFYLGMAALGGGIAGGDISKGMEDAVQVASSTVARGEQSAAPLQAAMATQPTQAAKDSIEALTSIASVDAAYKAIAADIRRQGRLDRQSENSLRSSAITAAQRAIDELGFEMGLNTPEQIAGAINQVVTLLMGQVTNPYYGQATSPDMRFYADDQQLIDRSASNATGS